MGCFNVDGDIPSIKIFTLHINSSITSFSAVAGPLTTQPMKGRSGWQRRSRKRSAVVFESFSAKLEIEVACWRSLGP